MDKREFLKLLHSARAEWDALLANIDEAQMREPGVEGDWSIKDIVAHVTWFEREMVGVIQSRTLAGSELWNLPTDERNAVIFEQQRARSLKKILDESRAVFQQLEQAAQTLTDEELNDARHFKDMPGDWVPWDVIAGNSFRHYPDHIASIRNWLEK